MASTKVSKGNGCHMMERCARESYKSSYMPENVAYVPSVLGRNSDETLDELLRQHDEFWRSQLTRQITFVKDECGQVLSKLHKEIERLQNVNRDLERRMHVETESLRNELKRSKEAYSTERINSANIRREFDLAAKRSDRISRTTEKITQQCKDQIANKDKTIQELNDRIRNLTYKNMQLQAKMNWTPRVPNKLHTNKQRSRSNDTERAIDTEK